MLQCVKQMNYMIIVYSRTLVWRRRIDEVEIKGESVMLYMPLGPEAGLYLLFSRLNLILGIR